jgi:FixJ family two-component response regulator
VSATLPQATIYAVEDDVDVLISLRFLLEAEGFTVKTYADGAALLADALPRGEDCLVIDYLMGGMDGFDLIDRLRERGVAAPVVLVTAYPSASVTARAEARGVNRIIPKPHLEESLATHVRAAIRAAEDLRNSP